MKKPAITDEERQLFRENIKGVKPFRHDQTVQALPTAKQRLRPISIRQPDPDIASLATDDLTPIVEADNALYFSRAGVQHREMQHMRRGQINIRAELDLHGMTLDQAEQKLAKFLAYAFDREWRYLLVIHGKGAHGNSVAPVLKNKVNQWLRAHPQVLAFCSANPFQGGVGAVYVLLKRRK